jgi:hypothetical protein
MPFDITQFRSQMTLDGARPNLFEVAMAFPSFSDTTASQKLTFMCKTAQLPGSTVNPVPVYYFGREIKLAGNRQFPEWSISVINDEDFTIRTAFELWLNGMNSHRGNLRNASAGFPEGYTQDATVTHFGKTGNIIRTYKFIGMFPNDVAPIDVDWSANDTVEEFAVTLSYQWWESVELGII